MFDVTESIENGYLWNFSPTEQRRFRRQHKRRQAEYYHFQGKLLAMVATDDPAIFANYDPHPSTPFEIKYTLNRIYLNDPRETEFLLNSQDPIAWDKNTYTKTLAAAFEDNTYCQTIVLDDVRFLDGWRIRGYNDKEASHLLDVFSDKKLTELTFTSYPLLTDVTYLKIANMAIRPDNRWSHVTLGPIPVAPDIADIYDRSGKVSYQRVDRQKMRPSFLSHLFRLGQTHERS